MGFLHFDMEEVWPGFRRAPYRMTVEDGRIILSGRAPFDPYYFDMIRVETRWQRARRWLRYLIPATTEAGAP